MSAMENIMFATDEGEEDELYTGYDFNSIATVSVLGGFGLCQIDGNVVL